MRFEQCNAMHASRQRRKDIFEQEKNPKAAAAVTPNTLLTEVEENVRHFQDQ